MNNQSTIKIWQEAQKILEKLYEHSHEEALEKIKGMQLSPEVEKKTIRLLQAREQHNTLMQCSDSAFFEQFQQTDLTGSRIDQFQLIELIAKGGMSAVYRARNTNAEAQKDVAIKVMPPQLLNTKTKQLFAKELATLSKLHHPNIVSMHHGKISDIKIPYLQMELIENAQSITQYCQSKVLETKQVIELFNQLFQAMEYAHLNRIIHRDIKPSNVLVDSFGQVKVIDFGISAMVEQTDATKAYTKTYAAPEQLAHQPASTASDIYSASLVLLECLYPDLLIEQWVEENKPIDDKLKSLISDNDLRLLFASGLASDPARRYNSIAQLSDDLKLWMQNRPLAGVKYSWFYKFKKTVQRQPVISVLSGLLIVSLLAGFSFSLWQMQVATQEKIKAVQVKDFLLNSIRQSDPDIALGEETTVKDMLLQANQLVQSESIQNPELAAEIYQVIGSSLNKIGEFNSSLAPLNTANALRKNHFETLYQLATTHIKLKNHKRATELIDSIQNSGLSNQEKVKMRLLEAQIQTINGHFTEAENTYLQAITMAKNDDNARGAIAAQIKLSEHYSIDNQNQQAKDILKSALTHSQQTLGPKNTTTLEVMAALAETLQSLGSAEVKESIQLLNELIPLQKEILGESHPAVAKSLLFSSASNKFLGTLDVAVQDASEALTIAESNFGLEHALPARIKMNMAQIYLKQGELEQAVDYGTESLKGYVKHYGENHYQTLQQQTSVAALLLAAGESDQAFKLAQKIYPLQKQQLGPEHRGTLYVKMVMARALIAQKAYTQALDEAQACFDTSLNAHGKSGILTIGCALALEEALYYTGDFVGAKKMILEYQNEDVVKANPAYVEKLNSHLQYINDLE